MPDTFILCVLGVMLWSLAALPCGITVWDHVWAMHGSTRRAATLAVVLSVVFLPLAIPALVPWLLYRVARLTIRSSRELYRTFFPKQNLPEARVIK